MITWQLPTVTRSKIVFLIVAINLSFDKGGFHLVITQKTV